MRKPNQSHQSKHTLRHFTARHLTFWLVLAALGERLSVVGPAGLAHKSEPHESEAAKAHSRRWEIEGNGHDVCAGRDD